MMFLEDKSLSQLTTLKVNIKKELERRENPLILHSNKEKYNQTIEDVFNLMNEIDLIKENPKGYSREKKSKLEAQLKLKQRFARKIDENSK